MGNIVITGGTGNLLGVAELVKNTFGVRVKIAKPKEIKNIPEEHRNPQFATVYGLIHHAISHQKRNTTEFKEFDNRKLLFHRLRKVSCYNSVSDFLRKYF